MRAYRVNNSNLTRLEILRVDLQQNETELALTLSSCTNIEKICLNVCNINVQKLLPMVEVFRGCRSLKILNLDNNQIGNDGCEALATLLADPNCNVQNLLLADNPIGNDGTVTIANSLINNTKLKNLFLTDNPIDRCVDIVFYNLLCNKTSISSIYSSNHTLRGLYFGELNGSVGHELSQCLIINRKMNKSHVAMKKILKYNNLDMAQLYGWDSEDEYSLKALPFVMDWFERARIATGYPFLRRLPGEDFPRRRYNIDEQKLSAIYQFARDMPLSFIPASHINGSGRELRRSKRKRLR